MYDENYQVGSRTSSALAACLANVYWWMTFALLVSGVIVIIGLALYTLGEMRAAKREKAAAQR